MSGSLQNTLRGLKFGVKAVKGLEPCNTPHRQQKMQNTPGSKVASLAKQSLDKNPPTPYALNPGS